MYSLRHGGAVRAGLVVVGVAFLVVGGAALATLYLVPPASTEVRHDSTVALVVPAQGTAQSPNLWGENGSGASFSVRWQSSAPVRLLVWANGYTGCGEPLACPPSSSGSSTLSAQFNTTVAGTWSTHGAPAYPYVLVVTALGSTGAAVSIAATGIASVEPATPALEQLIGTSSGALVAAVGAIALFLGMFLRSDPYGSPPGPVPRSAEDIDIVYPAEQPPGRRGRP
jgi:hypothetical protein